MTGQTMDKTIVLSEVNSAEHYSPREFLFLHAFYILMFCVFAYMALLGKDFFFIVVLCGVNLVVTVIYGTLRLRKLSRGVVNCLLLHNDEFVLERDNESISIPVSEAYFRDGYLKDDRRFNFCQRKPCVHLRREQYGSTKDHAVEITSETVMPNSKSRDEWFLSCFFVALYLFIERNEPMKNFGLILILLLPPCAMMLLDLKAMRFGHFEVEQRVRYRPKSFDRLDDKIFSFICLMPMIILIALMDEDYLPTIILGICVPAGLFVVNRVMVNLNLPTFERLKQERDLRSEEIKQMYLLRASIQKDA